MRNAINPFTLSVGQVPGSYEGVKENQNNAACGK